MKLNGSHVIGFLLLVGLGIYFFTKTKVSGEVIADESGATVSPTITYNPMTTENRESFDDSSIPRAGSVSFGTELRQ